MKTNSELVERISRSIKALKEAINRLQVCRTSEQPADSFAALTEALDWVTKLDIDLHKLCPETYRQKRDNHQSGRGVLGHRFARGLNQHNERTVDLVNVTRGVQFPVRPPVCPWELQWKVRTDLPYPEKHNLKYVESYDKYLAGRLARETLFGVLEFFEVLVKSM